MPWLVITGGQACRVSGKLVNRASLQQCASTKELNETIDRNLRNIYSYPDGYEPPAPHLKTFALGFQIQDHSILKNKVLPEMQNRMKRLGVSWRYDAFYEDDPVEGSKSFHALSHENCKTWLQSVADNLLDSGLVDEEQIAMYEFTGRPDGFRKPEFTQVLKPWRISSAATFANDSIAGTSAALARPSAPVAPSPPATARPQPNHGSVATPNDGAGPSKAVNPVKMETPPKRSSEEKKQHKIPGIRAALRYNGYPTDVIEDLVQNKLKFESKGQKQGYRWSMVLPNGNCVRRYLEIDANPYPGGKVTPESERKCAHCSKAFGHLGGCLIENPVYDAAAHMEHKTVGVRNALQSAGYPPEIIEKLMKENFYIVERPEWKTKKLYWSLKLLNGRHAQTYLKILETPYSGGNGADNTTQICLTPGCHQTLGHAGRCASPPSSMYDSDELVEDSEEEEEDEKEEVIHQPEETREERWKRRQWPMEKGKNDSGSSGGDEGLASTEVISEEEEDCAGSVGFTSLKHEIKQENCDKKAPLSNKRTSPDGAGGSSLKPNFIKRYQAGIGSADTKRERKIAGIRAALHYAGYPPEVIENLLAKKLNIYPREGRKGNLSSFQFFLELPNGEMVCTFAQIERSPYPGGHITPKSETKCHVDGNCVLSFAHLGSCFLVDNEAQDDTRAPLHPANKKTRAENTSPLPSARPKLLLSSSSDDEDDGEEKAEEELEAEAPRAESPIYLLTTTEEDNTTSSSGGFDSEDESIAN